MAWPQRGTISAKDILGMETDEFQTKLNSAASKDDLTAATSKIEELGTSLSAIQASLAKLTTPPPQDPDPNIAADLNDPTTQMLTDPTGFVQRQNAGTQQLAMQARADVLEMRARQEYGGAFQKYGEKLMESARNFNLQQRTQDGFWGFHIRTFMGDKLVKGELDNEGGYPTLMGGSSFSPGTPSNDRDPNAGLDAEVASFLKDRGIKPETAGRINALIKDGEPISMETWKGRVGQVGHA